MFCPQCGANQTDDLKFCNLCGANLHAVRQVVATRETNDKIDWGKTWVGELFLSEGERKRRQEELERLRGITPEVKRYNEIKAGVITGCVGIAVMIFLNVLFRGLILSGQLQPGEAAIFSRLWVAGIIPLLVGCALVINGAFVSTRIVKALKRSEGARRDSLDAHAEPGALRAADTSEFLPSDFSVTEGTTKHLRNSVNKS